jgi:methylmalonyl-CoA mutase N-terminal domain/subunit
MRQFAGFGTAEETNERFATARIGASEGEIVTALQQVWGDYRQRPAF